MFKKVESLQHECLYGGQPQQVLKEGDPKTGKLEETEQSEMKVIFLAILMAAVSMLASAETTYTLTESQLGTLIQGAMWYGGSVEYADSLADIDASYSKVDVAIRGRDEVRAGFLAELSATLCGNISNIINYIDETVLAIQTLEQRPSHDTISSG